MRNKEGFQILGGEIITIVVSRGPPEGLGGLVSGQWINAQEVVISKFPGLSMGYMFLASQSVRKAEKLHVYGPTAHASHRNWALATCDGYYQGNCVPGTSFNSSGVRHTVRSMSMKKLIAPARTIDAVHSIKTWLTP